MAVDIPKFYSAGQNHGRFYALAYVRGSYGRPGNASYCKAFYILDFSPSKNFSRFSFATYSLDGRYLAYTRGSDDLATVEYALLTAWDRERVPLYAWSLFPSAAVVASDFKRNIAARKAYDAERRRLALILWHARTVTEIRKRFPFEPLFHARESDFPKVSRDAAEYQELGELVMDHERNRAKPSNPKRR